jgi:hypothetical protein
MNDALAVAQRLDPRDDAEAMLAAQMGARDVIEDFSSVDRVKLSGGLAITSVSTNTDANGDGRLDTVLRLNDGGRVVLSDFTLWSNSYVI